MIPNTVETFPSYTYMGGGDDKVMAYIFSLSLLEELLLFMYGFILKATF